MFTQDITASIRAEAAKVLVGQEEAFTHLLIALLSGGHVLLEGVPGTAKTLMAKTLAMLTQASFKRVQSGCEARRQMPGNLSSASMYENAARFMRCAASIKIAWRTTSSGTACAADSALSLNCSATQ